jgi:DNA-binding transcriptional ArsR family regulator
MLSNIITKVSERIIAHLLENEMSLSELARQSKTTKANVFMSLKKLEKEDIVRKEVRGRTHIYRFNYVHPGAYELMNFFLEKRKKDYNNTMNGLPSLLNSLFENILKGKYHGCIFFGSSLKGTYKDIDVFVITEERRKDLLQEKIRKVNEKVSLVLGNKKELERGMQEEDMLYKNILEGIPFGCERFVQILRKKEFFLRRKDITERFILGYREILSCMEFQEEEYVKKHMEKGTTDVMYAVLNYGDIFPRDDNQARKLFKEQRGFLFSHNTMKVKKQIEKMGAELL